MTKQEYIELMKELGYLDNEIQSLIEEKPDSIPFEIMNKQTIIDVSKIMLPLYIQDRQVENN